MVDLTRLIEGPFSEGLETLIQLVRDSGFTVELGKRIRQPGGVNRAIRALRNEFLESDESDKNTLDNGEYRVMSACLDENGVAYTVEKCFYFSRDQFKDFDAAERYRPATQIEVFELYRAYPELLNQYWFMAFGSMTNDLDYAGKLTSPAFGQLYGSLCNRATVKHWPYNPRYLFVNE